MGNNGQDVDDYVSCSGNTTQTTCKIPVSMGFSAYTVSVPRSSSSTTSSSSGGGGGGTIAKKNTTTTPNATTSTSTAGSSTSGTSDQSSDKTTETTTDGSEIETEAGSSPLKVILWIIGILVVIGLIMIVFLSLKEEIKT